MTEVEIFICNGIIDEKNITTHVANIILNSLYDQIDTRNSWKLIGSFTKINLNKKIIYITNVGRIIIANRRKSESI